MEPDLELAASVMLALARDIPRDTIKPLDYWPRLRSAFETAASEADDYPGLVCCAGKRLGIHTVCRATGEALYQLRPSNFEMLREAYTQRALYVVILAQVRKDEAAGAGELLTAETIAAMAKEGGA